MLHSNLSFLKGGLDLDEFIHEYAEHWFHNPTPLERAGGIWPIRAGHNEAKSNYKMGPRIIPYYSVHFVLRGEGYFSQNETQNKQIQRGDLFCLFPNQTHEYSSNPNNPLKMFWLAFDGKQALALLDQIGITNYSTHVEDVINEDIINMLDELSVHFKQGNDDDELSGTSIIYKLFYHLSTQAKRKNITPNQPTNWLQKSKEYMDMFFAENISVKDVAQYVGIHRSYLTSSFVKKEGVTPSKYILSLKMNKAVKLMAEDTFTITEIALSLGYSDLYSFSRAFKNYYNVSPNKYL